MIYRIEITRSFQLHGVYHYIIEGINISSNSSNLGMSTRGNRAPEKEGGRKREGKRRGKEKDPNYGKILVENRRPGPKEFFGTIEGPKCIRKKTDKKNTGENPPMGIPRNCNSRSINFIDSIPDNSQKILPARCA